MNRWFTSTFVRKAVGLTERQFYYAIKNGIISGLKSRGSIPMSLDLKNFYIAYFVAELRKNGVSMQRASIVVEIFKENLDKIIKWKSLRVLIEKKDTLIFFNGDSFCNKPLGLIIDFNKLFKLISED